jgi:sugar phosphate isomerase/epimerase
MDDESSYGPAVEVLKKMGSVARDAGITLGLELSLSLADYQKLIALVDHSHVRPYWDATGTDHMGNPGDGLKGLEVLGRTICQMHLKNGRELMETHHLMRMHPRHPDAGRAMSIDWRKALPIVKASGFEGWFAFETPHASPEACIEETKKNIAFVMQYLS